MAAGETPSLTGRFHWRDPQDPRTYTYPPSWESAAKGRNLLVGSRGSDWKLAESQASDIAPSWTPPRHTAPQCSDLGCPHPGEYLRLCPLHHNRCAKTKKYGPSERTDQNSRKRTKWCRHSQPITCTVQNTGNQEAHRIGWIWSQIRWKNEGYAKWNKRKCTGNQ